MQKVLECTILKQSFKTKELFVAVPIGMTGGYFVVNAVLLIMGAPLFQKNWMPYMCVLFAILLLLRILLWFTHKGKLLIYKDNKGEMSVKIAFRNQQEIIAKGRWSLSGMYTRTETLPGMAVKYTYLALMSNEQVFCWLRSKRNALQSVHPVYEREIHGAGLAEEYWCGQTNKIIALIEGSVSTPSTV